MRTVQITVLGCVDGNPLTRRGNLSLHGSLDMPERLPSWFSMTGLSISPLVYTAHCVKDGDTEFQTIDLQSFNRRFSCSHQLYKQQIPLKIDFWIILHSRLKSSKGTSIQDFISSIIELLSTWHFSFTASHELYVNFMFGRANLHMGFL